MRMASSVEMPEPSQPYVLGDLTIDYVQRLVSLNGRPIQLNNIEYRALAELSVNARRVLRRVWRVEANSDLSPMRTAISSLRRKLGDDGKDPTYIFTEIRVGYWMPKGETLETSTETLLGALRVRVLFYVSRLRGPAIPRQRHYMLCAAISSLQEMV